MGGGILCRRMWHPVTSLTDLSPWSLITERSWPRSSSLASHAGHIVLIFIYNASAPVPKLYISRIWAVYLSGVDKYWTPHNLTSWQLSGYSFAVTGCSFPVLATVSGKTKLAQLICWSFGIGDPRVLMVRAQNKVKVWKQRLLITALCIRIALFGLPFCWGAGSWAGTLQ